MSIREIYGLSFIFIVLYVPASTPRIHRSETVLQLSAPCDLLHIYLCMHTHTHTRHQQRWLGTLLGFGGFDLYTECTEFIGSFRYIYIYIYSGLNRRAV
jgi:hypothetical protein